MYNSHKNTFEHTPEGEIDNNDPIEQDLPRNMDSWASYAKKNSHNPFIGSPWDKVNSGEEKQEECDTRDYTFRRKKKTFLSSFFGNKDKPFGKGCRAEKFNGCLKECCHYHAKLCSEETNPTACFRDKLCGIFEEEFQDRLTPISCGKWKHTENAAIAGHSIGHLDDVTVKQCKDACCARPQCESFDYHKQSNECDLYDMSASEVGGLKADYSKNPYDDHYDLIRDDDDDGDDSAGFETCHDPKTPGYIIPEDFICTSAICDSTNIKCEDDYEPIANGPEAKCISGNFTLTGCHPKADAPDGSWFTMAGDCEIRENCVSSSNYPNAHANHETCSMTVNRNAEVYASPIFDLEKGSDTLAINGVIVESGSEVPTFWEKGKFLTWSSKSSVPRQGWELCFHEPSSSSEMHRDLNVIQNFQSKDVLHPEKIKERENEERIDDIIFGVFLGFLILMLYPALRRELFHAARITRPQDRTTKRSSKRDKKE